MGAALSTAQQATYADRTRANNQQAPAPSNTIVITGIGSRLPMLNPDPRSYTRENLQAHTKAVVTWCSTAAALSDTSISAMLSKPDAIRNTFRRTARAADESDNEDARDKATMEEWFQRTESNGPSGPKNDPNAAAFLAMMRLVLKYEPMYARSGGTRETFILAQLGTIRFEIGREGRVLNGRLHKD
jgi:hypothetical protein